MVHAALVNLWPLAAALIVTCGAIATLTCIAAKSQVQSPKSKVESQPPRPWTLNLGPWTRRLHGDERGSVQSLSFVLTVPFFIMLMLLAVQITQLMIAQIVVHYAAFAAARSASVWIPARVGDPNNPSPPLELGNWLNQRQLAGANANIAAAMTSPKLVQIQRAAALACVPIAPSRDLGLANLSDPMTTAILSTYSAYSSAAKTNKRLPQRLANKWGYASRATNVEVTTFHRRYGTPQSAYQDEPPLWDSDPFGFEGYFEQGREFGWRDEITVKVTHNFALLPGPGRLLSRRANEYQRTDTVSRSILQSSGVYYYPLSASATLVAEGEKSVAPFVYVPFWP